MRFLATCLGAITLATLVFGYLAEKPASSGDNRTGIVESNSEFALDLYRRLAERDENLFFSPYSISTAMGSVFAGAREHTARQIADTFHFTQNPIDLQRSIASLMRDVNATDEDRSFQLTVANALWALKGHDFLPEFVQAAQMTNGGFRQVDFARATESARAEINRWVADQTNAKITGLIPNGALSDATRMVLTNAVYFKANWTPTFPKHLTGIQDFRKRTGKRVPTSFMQAINSTRYLDGGTFELLELPYSGSKQSMFVILPKADSDIQAVEKDLTLKNITAWVSKMNQENVRIVFPKFRITQTIELSKTLSDMGMPSAFAPDEANFSGIDGRGNLFLSCAIHQSMIKVDEQGTEAAAFSVVSSSVGSSTPSNPIMFRADRPFIFLIYDKATKSFLFMGRLMNPTT